MTRSITFALAVSLSLACWSPAALASITITSTNTVVEVRDDTPYANTIDTFSVASIPSSDSLDASLTNQFYSRAKVDFSKSGGKTILSMVMSQQRVGGHGDYAEAYQSVYFTADENASYVAAGDYSVDDPDGSSGRVVFRSFLRDLTTDDYLYYSVQESHSTNDESFVLGGAGGDYPHANNNHGSPTGTLTAGHEYRYYTYALTRAYPDADGGAKASGNFTLTIGEIGVVPEPLSMVVWSGLGLVAGCVGWRNCKSFLGC